MKKKIVIVLSIFLFLNCNCGTKAEVSQQDIQRYSAYYSNGMQYFKSGQYSSAIAEFRKVLRFSPYDTTIQDALANAYSARAHYFKQTTKEYKKALNDYKSAYFYTKYWKEGAQSESIAQLSNTCLKEIADLERRLGIVQTPDARLQSARTLRAQGELAASGYDFQAIKSGKYRETALENLGNIYKNLNNVSTAMNYFKDAIDANPKNPKLHFLYGVILDEAQNYQASMEQYNLALQYGDKSPELLEILENKWMHNIANNPQNAQSYINLGAIYQKQGNLEGAKTQYLKAYQLDSSDDTALYNLASLYIQQKNYQSAIETYDKLLAKNPNKVEVLEYKADALEQMSRFDDALAHYETILTIEPNNKSAKEAADNIVMNHFSGQKLQNYMMTKASANPNSYEAQFNYALELHKNKDYQNAIQYYKKAQALNPSKEETYLNLAAIYIEQKNYALANDICQRGLMVLPNNQKISKYLAEIKDYSLSSKYNNATKLFEEKQYQRALAEYLQIPSKTTEVKMAIASCYWQMNDFKSANKYYLEILSKEPSNKEALTNSAWAYYSLNDFNNAKLSANKLLALDKTNKDALELMQNINESENSSYLNDAIAKYEKGEFSEALELINKYIAMKPDDEYGIYYKGLIFDELKRPDEAINQFKLLISKNPEFSGAYYSLAVDLDNAEKYEEAVRNYDKFLSLKAKNQEKDEMTDFAQNRTKELKEYLSKLNANK